MSNQKFNCRGVFVVGCPRSGTTLVQQIIGSCEGVYTCEETHFFSLLHPLNPVARAFIPKPLLLPRARKRLYEVTGGEGGGDDKLLSGFTQRSIIDGFVRYMDMVAINHNKRCWVEKTPRHLYFVKPVIASQSGVRVVAVIRDPIPTISSLYRVTNEYSSLWSAKDVKYSIKECVRRWCSSINELYSLSNQHNITVVSYNRLVENYKNVADRLCSQMGLVRSENMRRSDVVSDSEPWKADNLVRAIKKEKSCFENEEQIKSLIAPGVIERYRLLLNVAI